jgi:thiol-disulfide isomerase/thioredoxin
VASYVVLWIAVVVLGFTCLALLRQVGVLHSRVRPMGAHFAGEGPEPGSPAPGDDRFDYAGSRLTLVAFTSPTCEICHRLAPSLASLARQYDDVAVRQVDHGAATTGVFADFRVASTPYFVTVGADGRVRLRGVANTLEQVEVMIEESLAVGSGTA